MHDSPVSVHRISLTFSIPVAEHSTNVGQEQQLKFLAVNDSYIFAVNYLSCFGRNQQQAVSAHNKSVQQQSKIQQPHFSTFLR